MSADDDLSASRLLQEHFPGLEPRTGFEPDGTLHGMTAAKYACHLFDLEGAITTAQHLSFGQISAAILLALQDLTTVAWVPTGTGFEVGTTTTLGLDQEHEVIGKRFLVLPVLSQRDQVNHWMLAIVDKLYHAIYWYNTISTWPHGPEQQALLKYLTVQKLTTVEPRIIEVQVSDQPSTWESGLLVAEHARTFFREPSFRDPSGLHDWARSVQHQDELPLVSPLNSRAAKLQWTAMYWTGWVRLELGNQDLSPLRYPSVPSRLWEEDRNMNEALGFARPNCLPREFVGTKEDAETASLSMLDDMRCEWRYEPKPEEKITKNAVAVAFDTWVGGELGSFFDEQLAKHYTKYPYTRFRRGLPEAPPQFADPISLVADQISELEDPIEGRSRQYIADVGEFPDAEVETSGQEDALQLATHAEEDDASNQSYVPSADDDDDDDFERKVRLETKSSSTKPVEAKRQPQAKRQKIPVSNVKHYASSTPTDPTTEEWQAERQIRGPRLGRPLYNRADSPEAHLEPSSLEGWRGWTAELRIRKSGLTGENLTTL